MDLDSVQKAYSRWSRVYDVVFGHMFQRARQMAIDMLELADGDRVLEVGVGTGLSFPEFPDSCSVFGVDISRPMLERARRRANRPGTGIVEADACRLPFADGVFDAALAPYVVSAVPDPVGMMREVVRIVRDGGSIVVLNHFASERRLVASLERALTGTTRRLLGFHADFDLRPVLNDVGLEVVGACKVPPFGYWQAMRIQPRGFTQLPARQGEGAEAAPAVAAEQPA